MIEGLKFRVTSNELKVHFENRSVYHSGRAEEKAVELEKLRQIADKLIPEVDAQNVSRMNKMSMGMGHNANPHDLCDSMESDIRNHNNSSLVFKFFSEHLFEEDYTLTEVDLQRIEILKR
jgi:hypothetical protein